MEYGCIGMPLAHSFSKEVHSRLASYDYTLCELEPEQLESFFELKDFKAINVTIPYKKAVIPYLDEIDGFSKAIGAVNTIVNRDGRLYGYNTDFFGIVSLLEHLGINASGKKVAILGSGGTSNTAFAVFEHLKAHSVLRVSRTPKAGFITYDNLYNSYSDTEIIFNATPVGMFPNNGESPLDLTHFRDLSAVVDAVYNPLRTELVSDALSERITAAGGLYMLVAQAAKAVEYFLGEAVSPKKTEQAYNDIFRSKENIVLIGMPASGKTTLGKLISEYLARELFDTDKLIEQQENKSIPQIFSDASEAGFRSIEAKAVSEVSKKSGIIISTGGGVVLDAQNIRNLKQNGRLFFIDRPLESLIPTPDRPTANDRSSIEKRFSERYELYKSACDVHIDARGNIESVFNLIKEEL